MGVKLPDHTVVKLKKTLYGLKQSPMEWNNQLNEFLTGYGFNRSKADQCIYCKRTENEVIYVGVYVDDIITCGNNTDEFSNALHKEFKMPESDPLEWYLGIQVNRKNSCITLNQKQCISTKLKSYEEFIGVGGASTPLPLNYRELLVKDKKATTHKGNFPYRSMVGTLMYVMLGTRPDGSFAVSVVCRHLENPTDLHYNFVKQIYKYLRTNDYSLTFKPGSNSLKGFVDAAYANQLDYKSTTGYLVFLGDHLISWHSSKQGCYTHSSSEAEYVALSSYIKEIRWQQQLMEDIGYPQIMTATYEGNQSTIAMATNPQENHKRTKHTQVAFHSTRDYVDKGIIKLHYIPTREQLADCTTKILSGPTMRQQIKMIGLFGDASDSERQLNNEVIQQLPKYTCSQDTFKDTHDVNGIEHMERHIKVEDLNYNK
jgi:hypothetical protein